MGTMSRPHAGSLAVYPRKRASKELASFSSFPKIEVKEGEKSKPLNFLAYKAGMTHALGKDAHEKGVTAGHEVAVAATVLEAPPLKIFGVRAYAKAPAKAYGVDPLMDVFADGIDKKLLRKIRNFKKKGKGKKKKAGKAVEGKEKGLEKGKGEGKEKGLEKGKVEAQKVEKKSFVDLEKARDKVLYVRLLCHSQPSLAKFGKKKPDVCEIALGGSVEQQLAFAKEKLGKEIGILDVFEEKQFVDIKAVSKGKGMQGPVKRAGIKVQRTKAKKRRVVGSIGPWNPSTVMWQVPRPGQMGYHSRTEFNKKVLLIGNAKDAKTISPKGGFKNYGILENDFVIVAGSVVGPAKRAISLRQPIRKSPLERHKIDSLDYIAGRTGKAAEFVEEEIKVEHVVEKKEEKKEKKSVQDEIAAAAKGEEKREKKKQ